MQTNKLFLVCPFSQMEPFICSHFGEASFMTAPAAIFHLEGEHFFKSMSGFVKQESITDIYVVSDTSCPIVQHVLSGEKPLGLSCEMEIQQLNSMDDSSGHMAEKIVKSQVSTLQYHIPLFQESETTGITWHGLITNKLENTITTII